MGDYYTFNGSNSSSFTSEDIFLAIEQAEASRRKFEAEGAKIFRFKGDLATFKRALAASGVEINNGHPAPARDYPSMLPDAFYLPHPGSLQVWEIGGEVWISGDRANVDEAREGKRAIIELLTGRH